MNASSRRQKIEAMLEDEPENTFLRYGLAIELEKEGEHNQSLEALRELMGADPPYIPAFLSCARQLVQLGRVDQAQACLRDGIQQAQQQGDAHVADEMSQQLANLSAGGQ